MKFSQLKSLVEQGKMDQFQEQIEKQNLPAADYDLLLRQCIKNKIKNFQKFFNILVKKGADVNFVHVGGTKKSNLMVACEQGSFQSVQLLCSYPKIDFELEDSMKKTAPFYAIENKNKNDSQIFLDKVLKQAPHLIFRPANNQTMLILAIKKQKPQLVRILLNNEAEPNYIIVDSGNTALHEALKLCKAKQTRANKQIVKLLLEHGADPCIRNKKNKDAYQFADKFPLQALVDQIQVKTKVQQQDRNVTSGKQNVPARSVQNKTRLLQLNSEHQIEQVIGKANQIYDRQYLQSESQSSSEEDADQDLQIEDPDKKREKLVGELTFQIQQFTRICEQQHKRASQEINDFLQTVRNIANRQGLDVQQYGSFRTGLWLKNCDIDLVLIPYDNFIAQKIPNYVDNILDRFQMLLKKQPSINIKNPIMKNKKIKVPMLRFDIQFPNSNRTRKIDITVIDRNHNGLNVAGYISQHLNLCPQLKPLFFIIKSLTYNFKLNDPKNGGIRTYAIVIMILSFIQNFVHNYNQKPLGQLLLKFFKIFGFEYQYGYGTENQLRQDPLIDKMEREPGMLLTIYDPLNTLNNVGKRSRAYELQMVFRAAYIALNSNIKGNKLQFMFDIKKIFLPF